MDASLISEEPSTPMRGSYSFPNSFSTPVRDSVHTPHSPNQMPETSYRRIHDNNKGVLDGLLTVCKGILHRVSAIDDRVSAIESRQRLIEEHARNERVEEQCVPMSEEQCAPMSSSLTAAISDELCSIPAELVLSCEQGGHRVYQ